VNGMETAWQVLGASVRGKAHVLNGAPNQDAWGSASGPSCVCAVLADGHGNKLHFRSAQGARLAVEETISQFRKIGGEQPTDADILSLGRLISENWMARVLADLKEQPVAGEEVASLDPEARALLERQPEVAYGSTLLAVAAAADWVAYLQLGDGDILAVEDGGAARRPLPPDPQLSGNRTTSLCQAEAWKQMRVLVEPATPALIALSTDGYANCFAGDDDFLQIGGDYLQMARQEPGKLADTLPGILTEATEQGSGDDISLALMYRAIPQSRDARRAMWFWPALVTLFCALLLAAGLVIHSRHKAPAPRSPGPARAVRVP